LNHLGQFGADKNGYHSGKFDDTNVRKTDCSARKDSERTLLDGDEQMICGRCGGHLFPSMWIYVKDDQFCECGEK
jgi:hypothetical protein